MEMDLLSSKNLIQLWKNSFNEYKETIIRYILNKSNLYIKMFWLYSCHNYYRVIINFIIILFKYFKLFKFYFIIKIF